MKKPISKTRKAVGMVLLVLLVGTIGWAVFTWWNMTSNNYAEKEAQSLERALVEAGLKKESSSGDSGRGMDNNSPWYDVSFTSNLKKEEAVELITKVASENGYNLLHATPIDRGHLGAVADLYIKNWYFDNTSKKPLTPNYKTDQSSLPLVSITMTMIRKKPTLITPEYASALPCLNLSNGNFWNII